MVFHKKISQIEQKMLNLADYFVLLIINLLVFERLTGYRECEVGVGLVNSFTCQLVNLIYLNKEASFSASFSPRAASPLAIMSIVVVSKRNIEGTERTL